MADNAKNDENNQNQQNLQNQDARTAGSSPTRSDVQIYILRLIKSILNDSLISCDTHLKTILLLYELNMMEAPPFTNDSATLAILEKVATLDDPVRNLLNVDIVDIC